MLPGVLLVTLAALVAAAEAGAAAAVEAGEAAWTDSSTRAVPAGLTLLAMSSLIGRQFVGISWLSPWSLRSVRPRCPSEAWTYGILEAKVVVEVDLDHDLGLASPVGVACRPPVAALHVRCRQHERLVLVDDDVLALLVASTCNMKC